MNLDIVRDCMRLRMCALTVRLMKVAGEPLHTSRVPDILDFLRRDQLPFRGLERAKVAVYVDLVRAMQDFEDGAFRAVSLDFLSRVPEFRQFSELLREFDRRVMTLMGFDISWSS